MTKEKFDEAKVLFSKLKGLNSLNDRLDELIDDAFADWGQNLGEVCPQAISEFKSNCRDEIRQKIADVAKEIDKL